MLKRFWFTFRRATRSTVLDLGCGISAFDRKDANMILQSQVFEAFGEREIEQVIENVDVSTLDKNHIRPNMGNPALRGTWFPLV